MPRLLFLFPPSSYRGDAFLTSAAGLGVDVVVGSERGSLWEHRGDVCFLPLELMNTEKTKQVVLDYNHAFPLDAVMGVDEVTVELAGLISSKLKLLHNSHSAGALTRNKFLLRERLKAHRISIPEYSLFHVDDDPSLLAQQVQFPCIVKPTVLASSCGVIRANTPTEFIDAFRRIGTLLNTLNLQEMGAQSQQILVEAYIPGKEVALEGLMSRGKLRVLALFDKPNPLEGPFFEETIYVTPSRLPQGVQDHVVDCATQAIVALGIHEGPVHGEFRVNEEGVWVIEVAGRSIGGRCSQTLRFTSQMSLEEIIIRHALQMDIPSLEREQKAAGVMILPIPYGGIFQDLRGQAEALAVPGIEEITVVAKPGDFLVPLPEGTRYLGFMFARGDSPEFVEAALNHAHRYLDLVVRANSGSEKHQQNAPNLPQSIRF